MCSIDALTLVAHHLVFAVLDRWTKNVKKELSVADKTTELIWVNFNKSYHVLLNDTFVLIDNLVNIGSGNGLLPDGYTLTTDD